MGSQVLTVGAETVRHDIVTSFAEYFKPCGLRQTAIMPSYGLAEFTLCVASHFHGPIEVLYVDQQALMKERRLVVVDDGAAGSVCHVSVGKPLSQDGSVCRIVDPETCIDLGEDRTGEIWIAGPSKALGYFNDPQQTAAVFHGVIHGDDQSGQSYLRTGDQGFLRHGCLFITGRFKDLIIVHGRNIYPQDIEYEVEKAVPDILRPGCSAAFALEMGGQEMVAYVAEVRDGINSSLLPQAVLEARRTVTDCFDVRTDY